MKKKIMPALIVALAVIAMLTACGSSGKTVETVTEAATVQAEQPDETVEAQTVVPQESEESPESGDGGEEGEHVELVVTEEDRGFACIVTENGDIYWKTGTDSCETLLAENDIDGGYTMVHMVPDNDEEYPYLYPDSDWIMLSYKDPSPEWFSTLHEETVQAAFDEWKDEVYGIFDAEGLKKLTAEDGLAASPGEDYEITEEDLEAFREYALATNSAVTYLRTSILDTVSEAVGSSICDDAYNFIQVIRSETGAGAALMEFIAQQFNTSNVGVTQSNFYATIMGAFFDIDEWAYYTGVPDGYPYSSALYMWEHGLIPSLGDTTWRLHCVADLRVLADMDNEEVSANKAFAAVVTEDGMVYWDKKLDNTDSVKKYYGLDDADIAEIQVKPVLDESTASIVLRDGYNPDAVKIFPYLDPETVWTVCVLNDVPVWYDNNFEKDILEAYGEWREEIYGEFDFEGAASAFTEETRKVESCSEDDIRRLAGWVRAWHNIKDKGVDVTAAITLSGYNQTSGSLWEDFGNYLLSAWREVHTECPGSVIADGYFRCKELEADKTLTTQVADSVSDVMEALTGYYFSGISEWEYYDPGTADGYPFADGAELVLKNLVPYTDGTSWYLGSGENADIVFEITEEDLLSRY